MFQRNLSEVAFENKSLFSFVNGVIPDKKYTWFLRNEHIEETDVANWNKLELSDIISTFISDHYIDD